MTFHDIKVESVTRLTSNAVEIKFDIPEELKKEFSFNPGQYISVDFNGIRRDYSICSSPLDDVWSVGVKSKPNGYVSTYLNNELKKGDTLRISTPGGRFGIVSKPETPRTILAFAAGSGITPVLSIIKYTLQTEKQVQLNLFYCNRTPEETMFKDQIEELKKEFPNNFFPHWFFTRFKQDNPIYEGRLDANKLNSILNELISVQKIDEVLVCGPNQMINEITDKFLENGVHEDNVHFELFTPPVTEKSHEQQESNVNHPVEITVELDGEIHEVVWDDPDKTLLDTVLDAGIDAPYSCKGGICSSCMCRLEEGEVNLGENFVLTEEEIEEGIIVACCSKTKGVNVKINFDDI